MNKSSKKRTYYNQDVLNELVNIYGFSLNYIRKAIRGDRSGMVPSQIRKDYNQMANAAKRAIDQKVKKQ